MERISFVMSRLRDIKPLLAARREPSEAEYIKFMKEKLDSAVAERQIRSTD
jgi:preprotein translocase subunit Sss1